MCTNKIKTKKSNKLYHFTAADALDRLLKMTSNLMEGRTDYLTVVLQ